MSYNRSGCRPTVWGGAESPIDLAACTATHRRPPICGRGLYITQSCADCICQSGRVWHLGEDTDTSWSGAYPSTGSVIVVSQEVEYIHGPTYPVSRDVECPRVKHPGRRNVECPRVKHPGRREVECLRAKYPGRRKVESPRAKSTWGVRMGLCCPGRSNPGRRVGMISRDKTLRRV
jgi:hypothetical protein